MEKLFYLLYDEATRPGAALREALLEKTVPALRAVGAQHVVVNVNDEHTEAGTPIRKSDPPIRAAVAFWMQCADDRAPCEAALRAAAKRIDGYVVSESRPLVHATNPGGRTPGMNQITCISRKPGLSDEEFFRIWHGDHRRVAEETQSTTGYVRNVVAFRLNDDAPHYDAIVEETFPIEALTDPHVFYDAVGDEAKFRANLDRMMKSCARFLDFEPMECTHMSEYVLG